MTAYEAVLRQLVRAGSGGGGGSLKNMPSSTGLDRTRMLLRRMLGGDDREVSYAGQVVHVVGTNGKGTVAWKTASALMRGSTTRQAVGLYTSPHLFSIRERIRVNGEPISCDDFTRLGQHALQCNSDVEASYFELVTCMALQHFANTRCDAVVLEAGMGGRGDATNVISAAKVVCLTHVALDHCRVLGSTLEAICEEKLGVVKPRSRVVIGPSVPWELDAQIMRQCRQLGALSMRRMMKNSKGQEDVEAENGRIARACVQEFNEEEEEEETVFERGVRPPCRIESVADHQTGKRVVLDVGHNAAALQRVFSEVFATEQEQDGGVALVFALAQDKDAAACLRVIHSHAWRRIEFTQPSTSKQRKFTPPSDLLLLSTNSTSTPQQHADKPLPQAIRACLNDATVRCVVVCGSHAIMSCAMHEITPSSPLLLQDPFDTNEQGALFL